MQEEMLALLQEARDNIDTVIEMMSGDESTTDDDIEYIREMYHNVVDALGELDTYARQF